MRMGIEQPPVGRCSGRGREHRVIRSAAARSAGSCVSGIRAGICPTHSHGHGVRGGSPKRQIEDAMIAEDLHHQRFGAHAIVDLDRSSLVDAEKRRPRALRLQLRLAERIQTSYSDLAHRSLAAASRRQSLRVIPPVVARRPSVRARSLATMASANWRFGDPPRTSCPRECSGRRCGRTFDAHPVWMLKTHPARMLHPCECSSAPTRRSPPVPAAARPRAGRSGSRTRACRVASA